jgi:ABC-2 type transport system permease protein
MQALVPTQGNCLAALAGARWQIFTHSLHTIRGRLELASRVFVIFLFALFAVGGAVGYGVGAFYFVRNGHLESLAFFLWPVLFFWQIFPVMASAFTDNPESSYLLRFPLSYQSYFLVRIFYALLDPASFVGGFWLLGITIGAGIASPSLLPWVAIVLLTFALFNVLLTQMIFAWVEKWLLQRRTREILGVVFFLLFMSIQFIGPLLHRYGHGAQMEIGKFTAQISSIQQFLPPGAASHSIAQMSHAQWAFGLVSYFLLGIYTLSVFWLLSARFRAQYRGENLSEASVPKKSTTKQSIQRGWNLPRIPGPIAATFEKEVRYLARSGPMLFTLGVPLIMLVFFRVQGWTRAAGRNASFIGHSADLAFPLGAAYALLLLTNLSYNTFGGDINGGVQFFFSAPVRLREVLIAKNLAHTFIFAVSLATVWLGVWLLYHRPLISITFLTLAVALLVLPIDFTAGNLLSIYSPKKAVMNKFGQQRAAQITVLVSMALRAVVLGFVAFVIWLCRDHGILWLAGIIFLTLAGAAFAGYKALLDRAENMAFNRREVLMAELGRK